jgi:hypothetical protein
MIVGAAVATVSVAACKQPVTNGTNSATVSADNSMALANSATNTAAAAINAAANASATAPMSNSSNSTAP